jgi:hypothetical protein
MISAHHDSGCSVLTKNIPLNDIEPDSLRLREAFVKFGYCIVEGAICHEEIRALRTECAELLSTGDSLAAEAVGKGCIIEPTNPVALPEHVRESAALFKYGAWGVYLLFDIA